jgi:hypothetical protein
MQLLYNSDSFAVVHFDIAPQDTPAASSLQGGYEIVDKLAQREIYLQGVLADSFQRGVQALVDAESNADVLDDFISGWTVMAQQPLALH